MKKFESVVGSAKNTTTIKNKFISVITIIALYMIVGFSANNLMAQDAPDCDDICRGKWGDEETKTVEPIEDGFCKVDITYRMKRCAPCEFEIEIIPPLEIYDCQLPDFEEVISGSEALLQTYMIQAFRALVDGMALDLMEKHLCHCIDFKTISISVCLSKCSFTYQYRPVPAPPPPNNLVNATVVRWERCESEGCCIRNRQVCRTGTEIYSNDTFEQSANSYCPDGEDAVPEAGCQYVWDMFNSQVGVYDPHAKRFITKVGATIFRFHCNTECK